MPALVYGAIDLTAYPYQLFPGQDLGAAAAITAVVERLLTDGENVSGRRRTNRAVSIPLGIVASSADELAAAEVALALEADKAANSMVITYDGSTKPVVADTYIADLVPQHSDIEDAEFIRSYTLSFAALPFLRSPTPTVITPSAAAGVLIDSLDSATGITASANSAAVAVDSSTFIQGTGSLKATIPTTAPGGAPYRFFLVDWSKTISAIDLSATPFVGIDAFLDGFSSTQVLFSQFTLTLKSAGGQKAWKVTTVPATNGFGRIWFDLSQPATTTGTLNLAAVTGWEIAWNVDLVNNVGGSIRFDHLQRAQQIGGLLTAAQGVVNYVGIQGAARTPAGFVIGPCVTANARRLMIATSPNAAPAFNPLFPISTSAGTSTSDSTALSGAHSAASAANSWEVPASAYGGTYIAWARVKATTLTSNALGIQTELQGDSYTVLQARSAFGSGELSTSDWTFVPIGPVNLPPREVDPANTSQLVDLIVVSTNVYVDTVYLVDADGEFMLVDLPSGTSYKYWWVDAPQPGDQAGKVFAGPHSDRHDAISLAPYLRSPTVVNVSPGDQSVLFVLDGATGGAEVDLTYYPRWLASRPS